MPTSVRLFSSRWFRPSEGRVRRPPSYPRNMCGTGAGTVGEGDVGDVEDDEGVERAARGGALQYVLAGGAPPAERAPNMYDSFEEPPPDLAAHVGNDALRRSTYEAMRAVAGRLRLLDELESGALGPEQVPTVLATASAAEKNICLFWAAFLKLRHMLGPLLCAGADPMYCDALGLSPLHVAAFSGSEECARHLLGVGVPPDYMPRYFSPLHCAALGDAARVAELLIARGASVHVAVRCADCEGGLLHCAVRADSVDCLRLFLSYGVDVNCIEPGGPGIGALHLAADLGMDRCLQILLDTPGADPNLKTREKESTALHLAADGGFVDCVDLLLAKGADASIQNYRGFTALHLAARSASLECVESLLRKGKADPNALDMDKRTPLHAAISKSDSACDIIDTLIAWDAKVNVKDEYGFTPVHLAAIDGSSACVDRLIFHGADVTTRSKKGTSALNVIVRKTPASLDKLKMKWDSAITLRHDPASNREPEVEFDFRGILHYPREVSYLNTFVDEGQKEMLEHPLCSAFVYIKWEKIRKLYIARLLLSFIFILCLTLYVLTALAHNCYNESNKEMVETFEEQELCQKQSILGDLLRKNPFVMEMQWWVLAGMTIFEVFRKIYGIAGYANSGYKQYLMQPENILEWFVIVSVFLISCIYTNSTYPWQNHVGAFAILAAWSNLMFMIGQLPVFGTYVAMYQKVQKEFAKLLMAYSCILIGFTFSFCVIFPDSSSFANPFMGFITVLTMMIGELNLDLLLNEPDETDPPVLLEFSAQITYVMFLMFVTVVLMNLLVGIAVHDIQGLRKTARLSKLVRQTKLISYMELALFSGYLPKWLLKIVHSSALVSPKAYRVVLSIKPLNPNESRLPKDIIVLAYELARWAKKESAYNAGGFRAYNQYEEEWRGGSLAERVDDAAEALRALTRQVHELRTLLAAQQLVIAQALQPRPPTTTATTAPSVTDTV